MNLAATERFWAQVEHTDSCWLWRGSRNSMGHGRMFDKTIYAYRLAHRLSFEAFKGAIPEGLIVMHSCDVPACVNPDHLSVGTHGDNARDRNQKGRGVRLSGEANPASKLTTAQVLDAIARRGRGETLRSIGKDFGVTESCICNVTRGKMWSHLVRSKVALQGGES